MKKKSLKKVSLQKTIISSFSIRELLGGYKAEGTSPKCAYSEWETCPQEM